MAPGRASAAAGVPDLPQPRGQGDRSRPGHRDRGLRAGARGARGSSLPAPVLLVRPSRPCSHSEDHGCGRLERGELADLLAYARRRSRIRAAAREVLGHAPPAAPPSQRRRLDGIALRPRRIHSHARCRVPRLRTRASDRRHVRPQPVPRNRCRVPLGTPHDVEHDRAGRLRPAPRRVPRRVSVHRAAGSQRGASDPVVPRGRLSDGRASVASASVQRARERSVRRAADW